MDKPKGLPKIDSGTEIVDLTDDIRREIEQKIVLIRAKVEETLSKEAAHRFGDETIAILRDLLSHTEQFKGISSIRIAEVAGKDPATEMAIVNAKIQNLLGRLRKNKKIGFTMKSQHMHTPGSNITKGFYYLDLKEEKTSDDQEEQTEPTTLEEPMALPINEKKKETLAKRIELAIHKAPIRALPEITFLKTLLEACKNNKCTTIKYAIQKYQNDHPGQEFNQRTFSEIGYELRKRLEKKPEEYGFTLVNEGQKWQAVLVETTKNIEDEFETLKSLPSNPAALSERVQDGIRHIATKRTMKEEIVSYILNFFLKKTLRGKWGTIDTLLSTREAKKLKLKAKHMHAIISKIREINLENPKILGFAIEKNGENNYRLCMTKTYQRAANDLSQTSTPTYPVYIPELTFDQHQFDRTADLWIRSNKREKTPRGQLLKAFACFAAKKQGISSNYAAHIIGSTPKRACQHINRVKTLLSKNEWGLEIVYDEEKRVYYLQSKNTKKTDERTIVSNHIRARTISGRDFVDMKVLAAKFDQLSGRQLKDAVSKEVERFVDSVAAVLISKNTEIDHRALRKYLTEIYSDRIIASRRVYAAKRHFKGINVTSKEAIFKYLAEIALSGKQFNKNKTPVARYSLRNILDRIKEMNNSEPQLLGFQPIHINRSHSVIEIRDNFQDTDLAYTKGTATFPIAIEENDFHFDQNTFDRIMLRWLGDDDGKRGRITARSDKYHTLIALATFAREGQAISVPQLSKFTGISGRKLHEAIFHLLLSVKIHSDDAEPLQLKRYKKHTFYVQTEKEDPVEPTPPEEPEQHEDPVEPATPASGIASLRQAHARVFAQQPQ